MLIFTLCDSCEVNLPHPASIAPTVLNDPDDDHVLAWLPAAQGAGIVHLPNG